MPPCQKRRRNRNVIMIGMTDISGVIRVREPFCRESFGNALSGSEDELPVHIVRQVEVPVLGHPL